MKRNWAMIRQAFVKGLKDSHGEVSPESLFEAVEAGSMILLCIAGEEKRVRGFCVAEIILYPQFKALNIVLLVGINSKSWAVELRDGLDSYAKLAGCHRVQAYASGAVGRMLRGYGFDQLYSFMGRATSP